MKLKEQTHYIKHFGTFGSPKIWKRYTLTKWEHGNVLLETWEHTCVNTCVVTWEHEEHQYGNMRTSCGNVGAWEQSWGT